MVLAADAEDDDAAGPRLAAWATEGSRRIGPDCEKRETLEEVESGCGATVGGGSVGAQATRTLAGCEDRADEGDFRRVVSRAVRPMTKSCESVAEAVVAEMGVNVCWGGG